MRLFWLLFLPAAAYQVFAITASLRFLRRRKAETPPTGEFIPAVSVLKPLRGTDPNTREAFLSQIQQHYPVFEILFGVRDENDPAVEEVRRLLERFPDSPIRLIVAPVNDPATHQALNKKVALLTELARHARYPIWVVNDSDIRVTPGYLREVVAPLADPDVGLVTCLYRVDAHTAPAAWEAIGISTDFMPSTLVAQLLGVREFGLGSTLAFRASDLFRAGGFAAFADFIADDYQLAKRITGLGKQALLSTYVVETSLGEATWTGIWNHQLRWARTIRTSKRAGYAGLPIAQAGLWIGIALLSQAFPPAAIILFLRLLSALLVARFVLRSPFTNRLFWLAPLWDLYAFGVWLTSYASKKVRWRDQTLCIDDAGRIQVPPRRL